MKIDRKRCNCVTFIIRSSQANLGERGSTRYRRIPREPKQRKCNTHCVGGAGLVGGDISLRSGRVVNFFNFLIFFRGVYQIDLGDLWICPTLRVKHRSRSRSIEVKAPRGTFQQNNQFFLFFISSPPWQKLYMQKYISSYIKHTSSIGKLYIICSL